jgi:hypothetical protein
VLHLAQLGIGPGIAHGGGVACGGIRVAGFDGLAPALGFLAQRIEIGSGERAGHATFLPQKIA